MSENNERRNDSMVYANQIIFGFLWGIGFVLATAFMRIALHMNLLN